MKRILLIVLQAVLFLAVCFAAAYGTSYAVRNYCKPHITLYAM